MTLGPVEVLVLEFPGSRFTGAIMPELERLVAAETISIIDGLFVQRDENEHLTFVEFSELGVNEDAAVLAGVLDRVEGLVSDEDVEELAGGLAPGSSAAILVFEHTWVKPLRAALVEAGGVLSTSVRIPGVVVEELLATVPELVGPT